MLIGCTIQQNRLPANVLQEFLNDNAVAGLLSREELAGSCRVGDVWHLAERRSVVGFGESR